MARVETSAAIAAELRKHWGWLLAWGLILEAAGVMGLGYTFAVSAVTTVFIGSLMVAYGLIEFFQAFRHRQWSGFFLYLVGGMLSILAGVIIWWRPLAGMEVLTLFVAGYFLVLGAFRSIGALSTRHPGWGWGFLSGAASLLLGVLVWNQWPQSSFWVIGLFVSIDMVFAGLNYVMLSILARRGLPARA